MRLRMFEVCCGYLCFAAVCYVLLLDDRPALLVKRNYRRRASAHILQERMHGLQRLLRRIASDEIRLDEVIRG